jgi:hypothetical protein
VESVFFESVHVCCCSAVLFVHLVVWVHADSCVCVTPSLRWITSLPSICCCCSCVSLVVSTRVACWLTEIVESTFHVSLLGFDEYHCEHLVSVGSTRPSSITSTPWKSSSPKPSSCHVCSSMIAITFVQPFSPFVLCVCVQRSRRPRPPRRPSRRAHAPTRPPMSAHPSLSTGACLLHSFSILTVLVKRVTCCCRLCQ